MDPQACWQRILEAFEDGDQAEVDEAMRDLWDWCSSGGFAPTDEKYEECEIRASHDMLQIVRRDNVLHLVGYNAAMIETKSFPFT